MYWLRACPRCQGDLHAEEDQYGAYVACIQCGYIPTSEEERQLCVAGRIEREQARPAGMA
jgi:DNA-directed RNA polymerase subunit M/transcription elongation factor TFIIS